MNQNSAAEKQSAMPMVDGDPLYPIVYKSKKGVFFNVGVARYTPATKNYGCIFQFTNFGTDGALYIFHKTTHSYKVAIVTNKASKKENVDYEVQIDAKKGTLVSPDAELHGYLRFEEIPPIPLHEILKNGRPRHRIDLLINGPVKAFKTEIKVTGEKHQ